MTNRVVHGQDPWARFATQTLPIRVGCPWADVPMGRIAGLRASLAEPVKTRTENPEFSAPNSCLRAGKWLAQNRARNQN
jgi:hypothetical protein